LCCNSDHLFLGTQEENIADMHEKGRAHKASGVEVGLSKVHPSIVVEIRERVAAGELVKDMASLFGITGAEVSSICLGHIWRDVGGPRTRRNIRWNVDETKVRDMFNEGSSVSDIALKLEVPLHAVYKVAKRLRLYEPRLVGIERQRDPATGRWVGMVSVSMTAEAA
jgi:hypothetical protein